MRAFVTGGTGFIGGAVASLLIDEGWDVTLLARTPAKAARLVARGATVHAGDVTDPAGLAEAMAGHDAVFHLAAWYALGARDRQRMESINVGGTENVLGAAAEAGIGKVVYCSSVAALGPNPHDVVGDETKQHPGDFGSIYEETKYRAHLVAQRFAAEGLDVSTVLPCAVYGPGDTSLMGLLIRMYARKLLLVCPFPEAGISFVHVDDVARGALGAFDKGRAGEDYILGGENVHILDMFRRAEPVTGIKAPRIGISTATMEKMAFLSPVVAKIMRQEPDLLKEAAANMRGSFLFSSQKAADELGYTWRSAAEGLKQTVDALHAG